MPPLPRLLRRVLPFLVASLVGATGLAQDFPNRPVRLVLPFSPGSTSDLVARTLSEPMARSLGQPVVVENVPGAGSVTGTDRVARAPKDGYTLGFASNNHVINPSILKNIPFDSVKDLTVVSVVATTPLVLVVHPSVPAQDTRELLALAKASPGKLNYGSAGSGTVLHLAAVMLVNEAHLDIAHVPYKAFSTMLTDLMGGQIQMAFAGVATVAPHIKSGRLRAIAISTPARSPVLPDVPTLAESGVPGYSYDAWIAMIAPAGVPRPVLERINTAARAALKAPEAQEVFAAQGLVGVGSTVDGAAGFFQTEMDKHAVLVKRSGASLD